MLSFSKCKYAFGCAFIMMISANFWMQLFETMPELIPEKLSQQKPENESVSEKMDRKRKILERSCSMIGILFEMSQNGTSYEELLSLCLVDSHFTASGFFGKVSQQTGKVSQQSGKVSQQTEKDSQQFCQNNKTFFKFLILFSAIFDPGLS